MLNTYDTYEVANGNLTSHLNAIQRTVYIVGGLFLLLPSQAFEQAYLVELAGAALCFLIFSQEQLNDTNLVPCASQSIHGFCFPTKWKVLAGIPMRL